MSKGSDCIVMTVCATLRKAETYSFRMAVLLNTVQYNTILLPSVLLLSLITTTNTISIRTTISMTMT